MHRQVNSATFTILRKNFVRYCRLQSQPVAVCLEYVESWLADSKLSSVASSHFGFTVLSTPLVLDFRLAVPQLVLKYIFVSD